MVPIPSESFFIKMKKTQILNCIFLLILSNSPLKSQSDTILVGYSQNDIGSSLINEMLVLPDNKIAFNKRNISGYTTFITDTKGQIINKRKLDYVDGYTISSSSFIIDDSSRYIHIGNATRNGKRYFISYSLDTTLQSLRLIDSVLVEDDIAIFTNMMKYNPHKAIWEGFGYGSWVSTSGIKYICYISLDEDYHFERFEEIHGDYLATYVIEFQWIEALGRYFIKPFADRSLIVDENLNVVKEISGITLVYQYNNNTHITSLGMYNCLEPVGSQMFCYAKENFNWPYNAAFATLDLQGDSIHVVEAIPLSNPPLGMDQGSQMRVDLDGNYIISGTSGFNPPSPNVLNIAKFHAITYEKLWSYSFQNNMCFALWDMEIDQNNDIVIVGQAWNIFGDGQARGFLMKVYENGTLTSYHEIPDDSHDLDWVQISPNPATSHICLQTNTPAEMLRLWDLNGRLMLEKIGASEPNCFDLPNNLATGLYAAEVIFPNGHRVMKKVVVSH